MQFRDGNLPDNFKANSQSHSYSTVQSSHLHLPKHLTSRNPFKGGLLTDGTFFSHSVKMKVLQSIF